jgi:hypothetical protein
VVLHLHACSIRKQPNPASIIDAARTTPLT